MKRTSAASAAPAGSRRWSVDVVVPCYNYAHFLPSCVDSVLGQHGVDVRVRIIDDSSSDDTPDVAERLAAGDRRVSWRRHEQNRGHIATYNEGLLEWADADLTVLLSADDVLAPGSLARASEVFARYPKVGMVYSRGTKFSTDEPPRPRDIPLGHTVWAGPDWIEGRCRAGHNVISSPEVVVRTDVQKKVGGYRPELPHAGDMEMGLRFAAVGDIGYVRGRTGAFYRVHQQSMLRTRFSYFMADLSQRREVFERFFAEHGDSLPDATRLHRLAQRALARDALWKACRAFDRNRLDVVPADELITFALETYEGATELAEYRALGRRQRMGPVMCSRTQIFIAPHVVKRSRDHLLDRTRQWRGV